MTIQRNSARLANTPRFQAELAVWGGRNTGVVVDPLEPILRSLPPHPLDAEIPAQLRPWLLSFDWDREKLWGLDLLRDRLAVSELVWHLKLPWWRHEGRWFKVSPHAFLERPAGFPEHVRRVGRADLGYPIHAIRRRDRWLIVDGIHRLVKAIQLGLAYLDAVRVEPKDLSSIARTQVSQPDEPRLPLPP